MFRPPHLESQGTVKAIDRAVEYLRTLAGDPRYREAGAVLPKTLEMAAAAGVSLVTMWQAVGRLRAEGVLDTGRGRRIRLAGGNATMPLPPVHETWRILADWLEADLLQYPQPALPARKELRLRYRVGDHDLRRALAELLRRKAITVNGRTYQSRSVRSTRPTGIVALIARGTAGSLHTVTPRTQDNLRTLERLCGRSGVCLEPLSHDSFLGPENAAGLGQHLLDTLAGERPLLGVMIWTVGLRRTPGLGDLVRRCAALGRPVAVLDEDGAIEPEHLQALTTQVRVSTMATSSQCCEDMARYLLALGHRRIAYLRTEGWTDHRGQGLARVYRAAGYADAVQEFTDTQFGDGARCMRQPCAASSIRCSSPMTRGSCGGVKTRASQTFGSRSTASYGTRTVVNGSCRSSSGSSAIAQSQHGWATTMRSLSTG